MVNNNVSTAVTKAAVSDSEMLAIMNAAGLKPVKASPLAMIKGKAAASEALRSLQSTKLVDNANRPTPACQEALAILANPTAEIDLVWGNPNGISLSKAYSAAGQDRLVSFTSMNGTNNISYFLSTQDITDLLAQRLAFTEIKDIAPLNTEAIPTAMPVFFALLDIYRESQLRSALERRQETAMTITPEEVNRIIQEAKLETNFNWYSPVAFNAMPLDLDITESMVNEGLSIMKSEGIIGAAGEISEGLTAFAYRAFPLAAFFGIKILTISGSSVEKTQLALFRGLSTLLLAQITAENGENRIEISSISTSQLPELLFNLGSRPFEATASPAQPTPSNTVVCSKCGTQNTSTAKFCSKCGATLAAAPASLKFCPKCGDPVTAGEKFCDKCGAALK
jgi:ribosomal protein L40E